MTNNKEQKRLRRHVRIRKSIDAKDRRLRLSVHRSNRYITGQIINDAENSTVVAVSSKGLSEKTYTERAHAAGKMIAEAATKAGIAKVVFDRGGYLYAGRVKAFAEGAREGGLVF